MLCPLFQGEEISLDLLQNSSPPYVCLRLSAGERRGEFSPIYARCLFFDLAGSMVD
jgi:hypothetical protein